MTLVIGIDFGTSRSGFGFAYSAARLEHNPEIHCFQEWPDQPVPYAKTPTQLLYSPDGTVLSWGWTAAQQHAEACRVARMSAPVTIGGTVAQRRAQAARWSDKLPYLVNNFKMMIKEGVKGIAGLQFTDERQRSHLVVRVIADYLQEMRRLIFDRIGAGSAFLLGGEVRWCLTIPAIWNDADKHLMREAAMLAGLTRSVDDGQLVLVLEPEAAALACLESQKRTGSPLPLGATFMVVDAGGGTVDLTVHRVDAHGLIEVAAGSGGACGSTYIDRRFWDQLRRLLGAQVFESLRKNEPGIYQRLARTWESAKCGMSACTPVHLSIDRAIDKFLRAEDPGFFDRLAASQGGFDEAIVFSANDVRAMFDPVFDEVVALVRAQFAAVARAKSRCDYIFLVGGFGESKLLQQRLEREFGSEVKRVVVPPAPARAVLEGAVHYGLDESRIVSRCARLTYGFAWHTAFEEGVDPADRKAWNADRNRYDCRDRFETIVSAGQTIGFDETVTRSALVSKRHQETITFTFYSSPSKTVRYAEEGVTTKIGDLTIDLKPATADLARAIDLSLYFGQTELRAEGTDRATGKKTSCTFKFERG